MPLRSDLHHLTPCRTTHHLFVHGLVVLWWRIQDYVHSLLTLGRIAQSLGALPWRAVCGARSVQALVSVVPPGLRLPKLNPKAKLSPRHRQRMQSPNSAR